MKVVGVVIEGAAEDGTEGPEAMIEEVKAAIVEIKVVIEEEVEAAIEEVEAAKIEEASSDRAHARSNFDRKCGDGGGNIIARWKEL